MVLRARTAPACATLLGLAACGGGDDATAVLSSGAERATLPPLRIDGDQEASH